MIYYGCPKCETPMSSPESMAGQKDICPNCDNVCIVPQPQATPPTPPPAPPHADAGSASGYAPEHSGKIITTEKTSKRLKSHIVFAWLALITGIIMVAVALNEVAKDPSAEPPGYAPFLMFGGVVLVMFGIVLGVATRIWIWWKHG